MTQSNADQPSDTPSKADVATPATVTYAFYALIASAVLMVLSALSYLGFTEELKKELIKSNQKLIEQKSSNARNPYTAQLLSNDMHTVRLSLLTRGVMVGLVLGLVAWQLLKGRGWTRWVLVVLAVVLQLPLSVLAFAQSGPRLPNILTALVGVSFTAALVLVFLPASSEFFKAHRPVSATGAPGGLLGNLFGGGGGGGARGGARAGAGAGAGAPAKQTSQPSQAEVTVDRSPGRRAPAKSHTSEDATNPNPSTKTNVARNKSKGR